MFHFQISIDPSYFFLTIVQLLLKKRKRCTRQSNEQNFLLCNPTLVLFVAGGDIFLFFQ
jgi:hypothetical protein